MPSVRSTGHESQRHHAMARKMLLMGGPAVLLAGTIGTVPAQAAATLGPIKTDVPSDAVRVSLKWIPVRGYDDLAILQGHWEFKSPREWLNSKMFYNFFDEPDDIAAMYISAQCAETVKTKWVVRNADGDIKERGDGENGGGSGIGHLMEGGAVEGNGDLSNIGPVIGLSDRLHSEPLSFTKPQANVASGELDVVIRRLPKPECGTAITRAQFYFEHNKGDAEITGVGVGKDSFSVSYDKTVDSKRWSTNPLDLRWGSFAGETDTAGRATRSFQQVHYFGDATRNGIPHWWKNTDDEGDRPKYDVWQVFQNATSITAMPDGAPKEGGQGQQVFGIVDGRIWRAWWDPATQRISSESASRWFQLTADPKSGISAMDYVRWGSSEHELHVFYRQLVGGIGHVWRAGGVWSSDTWEVLNGTMSQGSRPLSYTWHDQQHVFARTTKDELAHTFWQPGFAQPVAQIWIDKGRVKSNPTGFGTATQQHVFYRNRSGDLEHAFWDNHTKSQKVDCWWPRTCANITGESKRSQAATVVGDPAAIRIGDRQIVVFRTADGKWRGTQWTLSSGFTNINIPNGFSAGEAAVTQDKGRLVVMGRNTSKSGPGKLDVWIEGNAKIENWQ